jgi:Domain of unknown function (DUF397)
MEAINALWRKSSYSGNGGNCVEVADAAMRVLVRDTKDRTGPVLRFDPETWRAFADEVKRSLASDPALANTCRGALSCLRCPFAVSACSCLATSRYVRR